MQRSCPTAVNGGQEARLFGGEAALSWYGAVKCRFRPVEAKTRFGPIALRDGRRQAGAPGQAARADHARRLGRRLLRGQGRRAREYQALINEALRRSIRGGQIEAALRRVTREEPAAASPLLRSLYRKDFHIMPQ